MGHPKSVQAFIEEIPSWDDGDHLAGPPLSSMQWLVWALATAGKFFEGMIVFMQGVGLPLISEQFSLTDTDKGLITAATLAGILFGALFLGGLADRWGRGASEVNQVGRLARWHDIGKIGIPDSILQKCGLLRDH